MEMSLVRLTARDDVVFFSIVFVVYLLQFYSDVNKINLGEPRHHDAYDGILIIIFH